MSRKIVTDIVVFLRKNIKIFHSDNNTTMTITTTMSAYHNRYTFSGKEKDSETSYYYFGARYYNSDLSIWLSVDPMADKYPSLSPYNYCAWNPMKLVDQNGEEVNPVFGTDGNFRGCTKEGFTGEIIIYDHDAPFEKMSANELVQNTSAEYYDYDTHDQLSKNSKEKMYRTILSHFDETKIGDYTFCSEDMNLEYNPVAKGNFNTNMEESFFKLTVTDKYTLRKTELEPNLYVRMGLYEATVENIAATAIYHEWYGHYCQRWSTMGNNHWKCYQAVQQSPLFPQTTPAYQENVISQIKMLRPGQ
ncbi:MAG: RHS repeat-associated core domain-containing protein [Bacteroidales bacterium]|nr:RHS repeat-associated core domain-containing protein [Bacteroidales bacterium]